jgi:antitoxin CptB
MTPTADLDAPLSERALSRLRWRCRRGLLENDLFIERFFDRHAQTLSCADALGMEQLMALADNDLLDLLLRRAEPAGDVDTPHAKRVLDMLRT